MTAELWVWIAIAVAIVVVAVWPVLARRRRTVDSPLWTEELARARIEELEAELDRIEIEPKARAKAERLLLLAGAALAGGSEKAPSRAGRHAEAGLAAIRG